MKTKSRSAKTRKKPDKPAVVAAPVSLAAPAESGADPGAAGEKLTPEEQMERFAKELKNEDWGHQPC